MKKIRRGVNVLRLKMRDVSDNPPWVAVKYWPSSKMTPGESEIRDDLYDIGKLVSAGNWATNEIALIEYTRTSAPRVAFELSRLEPIIKNYEGRFKKAFEKKHRSIRLADEDLLRENAGYGSSDLL